jgi:cytosine/adenosine deaminase-related metal-dependent hydrolase
MRLLLKRLRWWTGEKEGSGDLRLRRGRVTEIGRGLAPRCGERQATLDGVLALPGLINCHDHLQLNLFPRLGRPPYQSFYDWAKAIYHPDKSPLREILRVPLADRIEWGALKNLIAGVTTVMHHDPYPRRRFGRALPVRVVERYGWSHSLGYGTDLEGDYHGSRGPYVIHAAEGIDERSAREIDSLDERGLLSSRMVLVHAVAVTTAQQRRLSEAGCSIIWCPASNLHLYGRTAPVRELTDAVPIGLGTDSTLSGSAHLLDELRVAAGTGLAGSEELLRMVTTRAAAILDLGDGRGTLAEGGPADLVCLRDRDGAPSDVLLESTPADVALVTVGGRPRLANAALAGQLALGEPNACIANSPTWLDHDISALRDRIGRAAGPEPLAANPLWSILTPLACP